MTPLLKMLQNRLWKLLNHPGITGECLCVITSLGNTSLTAVAIKSTIRLCWCCIEPLASDNSHSQYVQQKCWSELECVCQSVTQHAHKYGTRGAGGVLKSAWCCRHHPSVSATVDTAEKENMERDRGRDKMKEREKVEGCSLVDFC